MFSGKNRAKTQKVQPVQGEFASETIFLQGRSEKSRYQIVMIATLSIGTTLFIGLVEALNGFSFSSGPFL